MKLPCMLAAAAATALLATPAASQSYGHRDHCPDRCCPDHCGGGGYPGGGHSGGYAGYNPTRSTQTSYYSQDYSRYSSSYSSRYSYSGRESYSGGYRYSDRGSYAHSPAPTYYSGGVGYRDDEAHSWRRGAYLPEHRSRWYVRDYGHYGYPSPPDDCGYYRTDSGQVVVAHMGSGEVRYVVASY